MPEQNDVVELVKERNRIEDVIQQDGFTLSGHGAYMDNRKDGHLVVNINTQTYYWNGKNTRYEDVIAWVMDRHRMDFKAAVEWLCERARLPMPNWGHQDTTVRVVQRAKEDVFAAAADVWHQWLMESKGALDYAHGRGFTDDTLNAEIMGFSGGGENRTGLRDKMLKVFLTKDIDPDCPAAISVLGLHGEVETWGRKHKIQISQNWSEDGYIPGFIGRDMLIYIHWFNGRVKYYSGRFLNPENPKDKSRNPPVCLVGEKVPYFNHKFSAKEKYCVIVEGQADAISLSQVEIPAVALSGTAWRDGLDQILKNKLVYVGLDADAEGIKAIDKLAGQIGPMCRILHWEMGMEKLTTTMTKA
jgi:DNA primase